MLKKIIFLLTTFFIIILTACKSTPHANELKVGTIAGPETQLMEIAQDVAKGCYGLDLKIVTFSDYTMPNIALNDGSIDANMFQHLPYLEAQIKARGYKIVAAGKTFVYPMGIYSHHLTQLQNLSFGAKVAIPNDPSNQARALLLLQKAGLIRLKPTGILATRLDVMDNPKNLKFITLQAAQLPRALKDVAVAVINTNYAIPAGLLPSQALFMESADSPYANIIVVRSRNKNSLKVKELISALHSQKVLNAAKRIFGDSAIPAWDLHEPLLPCRSS